MSELSALLERLKAAKGASLDLDIAIEQAVGPFPDRLVDNYTQSVDAAIALVKRVLPGWQWLIRNDETRGFFANLHEPFKSPNDGHWSAPTWAATPALAILAALLSALIAKEQGNDE